MLKAPSWTVMDAKAAKAADRTLKHSKQLSSQKVKFSSQIFLLTVCHCFCATVLADMDIFFASHQPCWLRERSWIISLLLSKLDSERIGHTK